MRASVFREARSLLAQHFDIIELKHQILRARCVCPMARQQQSRSRSPEYESTLGRFGPHFGQNIVDHVERPSLAQSR
jgi:hypothetical protein